MFPGPQKIALSQATERFSNVARTWDLVFLLI